MALALPARIDLACQRFFFFHMPVVHRWDRAVFHVEQRLDVLSVSTVGTARGDGGRSRTICSTWNVESRVLACKVLNGIGSSQRQCSRIVPHGTFRPNQT
jgi:hypothetical protein